MSTINTSTGREALKLYCLTASNFHCSFFEIVACSREKSLKEVLWAVNANDGGICTCGLLVGSLICSYYSLFRASFPWHACGSLNKTFPLMVNGWGSFSDNPKRWKKAWDMVVTLGIPWWRKPHFIHNTDILQLTPMTLVYRFIEINNRWWTDLRKKSCIFWCDAFVSFSLILRLAFLSSQSS